MIIRKANTEDSIQIAQIYKPYVETTAISFEYTAPDSAEIGRRIRDTIKSYPYYVAEESGEILGYAYTGRYKARKAYDWSAEISIYVKEGHKGKGIGRKLYKKIEEVSRLQNITNLYACITAERNAEDENKPESVKFHEHMGYKETGRFSYSGNKFGIWYDTVIMEKLIGRHIENPPDLIPFSMLDESKL